MLSRGNWKRTVGIVIGVLVVVWLVLQLIPLDRTNPAVASEPTWGDPQARELAKRACFDCHSNETVWPWYARVAPMKFLIWNDVREGRHTLNFSEWGSGRQETHEIAEVINEGEMPPWYYTLMHSNAKLSDAEKQQLIAGLPTVAGGGGD